MQEGEVVERLVPLVDRLAEEMGPAERPRASAVEVAGCSSTIDVNGAEWNESDRRRTVAGACSELGLFLCSFSAPTVALCPDFFHLRFVGSAAFAAFPFRSFSFCVRPFSLRWG